MKPPEAAGLSIEAGATVVETYGLSPLQAGMVFESLAEESLVRDRGVNIEQMHIHLPEAVDPARMSAAWNEVARRHMALSTSFSWDAEGQLSQRLHRDVRVPLQVMSAGRGEGEASRLLEQFLVEDRRRGFNLSVPPLLRVTVFNWSNGADVIWTFHHAILDGRAMAPVLAEVFFLYTGLPAPASQQAPRPYRDYIAWLAKQDRSRSFPFFQELLAGKTSPTPLPPGGEPVAKRSSGTGYAEVQRTLSGEQAAKIRALAARTGTTLATVFQLAWALVLSRHSDDDDVVFGSTRACRRSALGGEAEGMIGLIINTLPMRLQFRDELSVHDGLRELRRQSIALREHEHTPLVDIQGQSQIRRGQPLFESVVVVENRELNQRLRAIGDPGWSERRCRLHEQPALPISLLVYAEEQITFKLLFECARFRPAAAERIASAIDAAIAGLSGGEDRLLRDVEVLPPAEMRRMLVEWNQTAKAFPEEVCIHQLFERRASSSPSAIAVQCGPQTWTYERLDESANRLARFLRAQGAGPGRFVGICLSRGGELVRAMLAVLKSGAAYVPLDADYPPERLRLLARDSGVTAVVTETRFRDVFGALSIPLDDEAVAAAIASGTAQGVEVQVSPSDVCYVIYTSGSTGTPKGVVLEHRAVVNTLDWVNHSFRVSPGDRLMFVTSPSFDLSVYDVFGVLAAGATVVVATERELRDPRVLAEALVDQRITIWDSAPAAFERLLPFLRPSSRRESLRLALLSGDWIPLGLPDAIRARFSGAQVISLGGATEAAIWSNWFPYERLDPEWRSIPYGRPIQNARYHVLDRRLRPTPIGVAGTLFIGGACLARGYLNRPDLTAERFIADPFLEGERLYVTGDRARYWEDGLIELLGRQDSQVKIRGFRVELGEVEAALASIVGVRQAVCLARPDASGQKSLLAYVVLAQPTALDEPGIKASLAVKLPDFMVPARVVMLRSLPLTANGKIDRNALPAPGQDAPSPGISESMSDAQRSVAKIWQEVLGVPSVSLDDDFFALGGHSLLAVVLVSRIKDQLGHDVPLGLLVRSPTIRGLTAELENLTDHSKAGHIVTFNAQGSKPPLVLLPGSGGYGFAFQSLASLLGPDQPLYSLQALGSEDAAGRSPKTIEAIADMHLQEIIETHPGNRFILGGYSLGVLIAFEIARRMATTGREVPLLVSFDGFAPGFPKKLPPAKRLRAYWEDFNTIGRERRGEYLAIRLGNLKRRALARIGVPGAGLPDIPFAHEALNRELRENEARLLRASRKYRGRHPLRCRLLLVKSEVPEKLLGVDMSDPYYGWRSFIDGPIDVVTLPGEHLELFREANRPAIARILIAAMERATPEKPAERAVPG